MRTFGELFFLGKLCEQFKLFRYPLISAGGMGKKTAGAVLDPVLQIPEIPAAPGTQRIERTVAEQAVEMFGICAFVAGKKRAAVIFEIGKGISDLPLRYGGDISDFPAENEGAGTAEIFCVSAGEKGFLSASAGQPVCFEGLCQS